LPKRADSASAAWPAGTIGIAIGACDGGTNTPPGPKPSPRKAEPGAVKEIEGVAENSELEPVPCAKAVPGIFYAAHTAAAIASRAMPPLESFRNVGSALAMTLAFSTQIAAISSQQAVEMGCFLSHTKKPGGPLGPPGQSSPASAIRTLSSPDRH
jgi:hypothetical protein